MKTIGITGGIGAGKSVVSRILREMGCPVYDCDFRSRQLMDESEDLKRGIEGMIGAECILADRSLDRRAIAAKVFADASLLAWLNGRVHDMVRLDLADWLRNQSEGCRVAFVESAVMKTSGLDRICDEIWLVDAPENLRIDRAVLRDNSPKEAIAARIKAQQTEFDNLAAPVVIIDNSGSIPLLPQIENNLSKIN